MRIRQVGWKSPPMVIFGHFQPGYLPDGIRRVRSGRMLPRQILFLREINDRQQ
jgi:hypothetical protein